MDFLYYLIEIILPQQIGICLSLTRTPSRSFIDFAWTHQYGFAETSKSSSLSSLVLSNSSPRAVLSLYHLINLPTPSWRLWAHEAVLHLLPLDLFIGTRIGTLDSRIASCLFDRAPHLALKIENYFTFSLVKLVVTLNFNFPVITLPDNAKMLIWKVRLFFYPLSLNSKTKGLPQLHLAEIALLNVWTWTALRV